MSTTKEEKEVLIKRHKDEPGYTIKYTLEVYIRSDNSKYYTYDFKDITPDQFIDTTLFAIDFWLLPCAVHLFTKNSNYHSLHFEKFSDFHQFIRGYKLARHDIILVDESPVPYAWLQKKVPNILDEELSDCYESDRKRIKEWFKTTRFKNIQPGDEIWKFRSDQGSWMSLSGREGYALLRKNEIVEHFITRLS